MKQKLFMLLAVILLGSASAFAQSGSDTPIKGDVIGDGVVDIADIAAVIDIMKNGGGTVTTGGYFYLGTTQPTADNYKTLPGVVMNYTSINDAEGASINVLSGHSEGFLNKIELALTVKSTVAANKNIMTIYSGK